MIIKSAVVMSWDIHRCTGGQCCCP